MKFILVFYAIAFCFMPIRGFGLEAIQTGVIFSFTGTDADSNQSSFFGTRFAADEINAQGGILGRQVKLVANSFKI